MKSILRDSQTGKRILLSVEDPYKGLTHFPKGSALEGLRIPRAEDAARAARNLIKAFGGK